MKTIEKLIDSRYLYNSQSIILTTTHAYNLRHKHHAILPFSAVFNKEEIMAYPTLPAQSLSIRVILWRM